MATSSTDAAKIAKYREMAKDKTIPQDVRNQYLDKANELEYKAYENSTKMAKGGCVPKKMAKGGAVSEYGGKEKYPSKTAMKKHEKAESPAKEKKEKAMVGGKKPVIVIAIGAGKPKAKMAKGGAVKKKC